MQNWQACWMNWSITRRNSPVSALIKYMQLHRKPARLQNPQKILKAMPVYYFDEFYDRLEAVVLFSLHSACAAV